MNKTQVNAVSVKKDHRKQSMIRQIVERVETLMDVMQELKVRDLTVISGHSGKVLQKIAERHHINVLTLYRWIREYKKNNGISLHMRGRLAT